LAFFLNKCECSALACDVASVYGVEWMCVWMHFDMSCISRLDAQTLDAQTCLDAP